MKRFSHLALLLLFLALMTVPAAADIGPKPKLTIRVINAPSEPYYLDLLEKDDKASPNSYFKNNLAWSYGDRVADLDQLMLRSLRDHAPEGWHCCLTEGSRHGPVGGNLYGENSDPPEIQIHTFGYIGVPDSYRIITVTKSGLVQISRVDTRQALWSSVTYNYTSNRITVKPLFLAYILQFFSTFLPTLAIEGILLLLFQYSWKKNRKLFLLVNLSTQLFLSAICGVSSIRNGVGLFYFLLFIPVELIILTTEALLYSRLLNGQSRLRAVCYAVTANLYSMTAGLFTAYPVFIWIGNHL